VEQAEERGAGAVLLLSSDLPLVTRRAVRSMILTARRLGSPAVVAAPATGRGGTNALYLAPPGVIPLQFGTGSLRRYEREAQVRGIAFALHRSRALALDLDEPMDLDMLQAV
jgi:2-phospho-L-lactate guanylyltransferase (CobY/MobA/RfbA family)